MNAIIKSIKDYWLIIAIAFICWFIFFTAWRGLGLTRLLHSVPNESILSFGFSIVTGIGAALIKRTKDRKTKIDLAIEQLKTIIIANNEAMKETAKRLEDANDGVILELRRLDEFSLSLIATKSEYTNLNIKVCDLVAEQERQKERLLIGDRLLHFTGLVENLIRSQEKFGSDLDRLNQDMRNIKSNEE